jgi:phosphoadenylyl-sulfate reductase (thioredoxin)
MTPSSVLQALPAEVADLEDRPAGEVLAWAAQRFGTRLVFATGFGAEGCVIVDLIARQALPIEIVTLDTGLLFPETYALWQRLERHYGLTIRGLRPDPRDLVALEALGAEPWQRDPDACCAARKLQPLAHALVERDAWITAIRREQTSARAHARVVEWDGRQARIKVNPLAAWTHAQVWAYVQAHDVPVNELHARGYPSLGCWPCTTPVRPGEDLRAGRWRGRAKTECGLHRRPQPLPAALAASENLGGRA